MIERYGDKLNFAHLRSTQRFGKGSFHEASHLHGNVDMLGVIAAILRGLEMGIERSNIVYKE